MLRERPLVAEGIDDLAVAVTPEHVLQWLDDLGSGLQGAFPERVDVVALDAVLQ